MTSLSSGSLCTQNVLVSFLILYNSAVTDATPCVDTFGDEREFDCNNKKLNEIPVILSENITKLTLSRNNLAVVTSASLRRYTALTYLDLSFNKIFFIEKTAFENLRHCETLLLNNNVLNFTLLVGVFDELTQLKTLDISGNFLWRQLTQYPSHLIANLKQLRLMTIDGIDGVDFDDGFSLLTSLTSLRIRSLIKHMQNTTLQVFRRSPITSITIWSGWLESIDSHAFAHFPFLETLDLSFNPRLGFHNASKAWPGLRNTNISTLILERASPFETAIVTIEPEFYYGLQHTRIKKVILNGNNIVTIHSLFSQYLPNLEYLSLSRNRLVQVSALISDLGSLVHLVYLDVSHQSKRLYLTEPELIAGLVPQSLQSAQGPDNEPLAKTRDLTFVEVGNLDNISNDVEAKNSSAPRPFYVLPTWRIKLPSTLEYLKLSGSLTLELESLPKTVLTNGFHLKEIEYASNGLSRFDGTLVLANTSVNPLSIDLSDNDCVALNDLFVSADTAKNIETLLLNKNKLGSFLNTNKGTYLVKQLTRLRKLDLNENGIKQLPSDIFVDMVNLEVLQLGQNALHALKLNFSTLTKLRKLNLRNNLITSLDPATISQLNTIARHVEHKVLNIDLTENPITCSCDNRHFLKWILEEHFNPSKRIRFTNFGLYYCFLDSKEKLFKNRSTLKQLIKDLDWICNRVIVIIAGSTLAALLVIVIILSVCIHRHKWDIRFWCIHMIIKKKEKHSSECFREYKYDAFVAYHENCLSWVKHSLMTNLEGNLFDPINLCVHHRDFIPGKAIEENIVESIKDSRKTILVITKDFIQSSWCYFEMQMARTASFDEKRDVIIAILLEPVSTKTEGLSQTLLNILRRQTYLVWPEDKSLRPQFWHRLHQAIRSPRQRPTRCECGRTLTYGNMRLPRMADAHADVDIFSPDFDRSYI